MFEGVKLEAWWLQEQTVAMLMCLNSRGLHNLQVGHIPYFILCRCFTCMTWEARKGATGKHIGNISILDGSVIKMPMMTPWCPLYMTGSNQALRSSVTAGVRTAISSHRVSRTAPSTTPSTSSTPTPGPTPSRSSSANTTGGKSTSTTWHSTCSCRGARRKAFHRSCNFLTSSPTLIGTCAMCPLLLTATRDQTTGHLLLQFSVLPFRVNPMTSPPPPQSNPFTDIIWSPLRIISVMAVILCPGF